MKKPSLHTSLFLLVIISALANTGLCLPDNEGRAEMCAEACRDAMHWENCARENGCNGLQGQARLFCLDSCLYLGVNCEFRCWDSYEAIVDSCKGRCSPPQRQHTCRECFLEEFEQTQ